MKKIIIILILLADAVAHAQQLSALPVATVATTNDSLIINTTNPASATKFTTKQISVSNFQQSVVSPWIPKFYTTTTNIIGTTNLTGATLTNNALTFVTTPGVWFVQGSLDVMNTGSGGVSMQFNLPVAGVTITGWNARWPGDFGSTTPFIRQLPRDTIFFQAFMSGLNAASMATFNCIITTTQTNVWGLPIFAQTLVPTNAPFVTTNSFILVQRLQ